MATLRTGVQFAPSQPLSELAGAARDAERLGFDELWVVEDCFIAGGIATAATALAGSSRLTVGVGLLPTAVRNAAIGAMELAALAELHPGRVQVAFGHGVESWMRQIDARPRDRLVALREVLAATRALLAGERVSTDGQHVRLDSVALERPPAVAPQLLVGTTGPRAIAIAAELADGVLLPEGAGPVAVAAVAQALPPGAALVVYAWLCVDDDPGVVAEQVRPVLTRWRDGGTYAGLVAAAGIAAQGEITADGLARVAIAGTAAECARAVDWLHDAGATSVVLVPLGDRRAQLERFAAEVGPLLSRGS